MEFSDGHWDYVDWRQELDHPVESSSKSFKFIDRDENEDSWSNIVKDKFQRSLSSFQKKFNLEVTGQLDSKTVELMQQPRCSVPDSEQTSIYLEESNISFEEGKQVIDKQVKEVNPKMVERNGKKSNLKNAKLVYNKMAIKDELSSKTTSIKDIETTKMPTESMPERTSARSTAVRNIIHHTPTLSTILSRSLDDDLPNRTENVDTEMTEVITEAVNVDATDIVTMYNGNDMITDLQDQRTESEHLAERRRRSSSGLLEKILHRSKRTSSYVCNYGFNPDNVITWRIMKKSGSNKVTDSIYLSTDSARAIVEEAFRRWAEVSTLTFREENSQTNVDVWIQFVSDGTSKYQFHYDLQCFNYKLCVTGELEQNWQKNIQSVKGNNIRTRLFVMVHSDLLDTL